MKSVGSASGDGQRVADKESTSASLTLRDGNNSESANVVSEVCSPSWRNVNHRCGYITIVCQGANGDWGLVLVPVQCLIVTEGDGSGSQSFTDETSSGPTVHHQTRSKALASEVSRGNVSLDKSASQSSLSDDGFSITNLYDTSIGTSKLGKPRGRKNRKKAKKKGKRPRKLSLDAGSAVMACLHESLTEGNFSSTNTESADSISYESTSTVLSPDSSSNTSEDNNGGIDEVDLLEINSSGSLYESLRCVKDSGSSVLPLANDSLLLDCISVCPNADDGDISSSSSVDMKCKPSKEVSGSSKTSSLNKFAYPSKEKVISRQKARGKDTGECSSGLGKVKAFVSKSVSSSKVASSVKREHNLSQPKILSTGEDKNHSEVKEPEKLKGKTSTGYELEFHSDLRKLSYASKSTSNLCTNIGAELNDAEDISTHSCQQRRCNCVSNSQVDCMNSEPKAETVDCNTCGYAQQLEGYSSKSEAPEKLEGNTGARCEQVFSSDLRKLSCASQSISNLCTNVGTECNGAEDISPHICQEKGCNSVSNSKVDCRNTEPEAETIDFNTCCYAQQLEGYSSKSEALEGSCSTSSHSLHYQTIKQECKSIPPHSECSSQLEVVDEEAAESSKLEKTAIELPFSEALDCSENSTECFLQGTGAENTEFSESEVANDNDLVEIAVDNVSNMIKLAVDDAYRAQLASEAFEKAMGCPVAELERFLRAASPSISLTNNISPCRICSSDEMAVARLCSHEIPNLALGNLWQWYEEHGTFGLEVKAEDCENSKRLGIDRVAFRAYFVPFLSAVQLFSPRRRLVDNSSCKGGRQIFSILVPQARTMGNTTKQFDVSMSSNKAELVYEYFEAARPQQRRPLFEVIKDLATGNEPSQGRAFGDPSTLVSASIKDLHPKSWYSVAWYPIYRIPEDQFHSAFLTYHSVGHLVHASSTTNFLAGGASLVSPVVGLQSYNSQGECWLQPRNLTQSQIKEIPNLNHCEILKERLRTLEHTSSVMARAEVVKGNDTSANWQSDYEFFISRHC